MAGNRIGGIKARIKNLANDPDFYANIGRVGGSRQVPKGFAMFSQERLTEIGKLGGSRGKRGKAKKASGIQQ